jgi:hypothetical protein
MKVALCNIHIDGGTQPRTEIDYELVHEYSECIDQLPPVTVFNDGASNWLADGFHRYHAYRKLNIPEIDCEVRQGSLRDAILYSVSANSIHGKRRTNADKRKAVLTLLNDVEWSRWSQYEIADQCNVTQPFVSKVKSSLMTVISDAPKESTYTTKHGTVATMRTENIGKSKPETTRYTAPEEEQWKNESGSPAKPMLPKVTKPETVTITISKSPANAADSLYIYFGEKWVLDFANHIIERLKEGSHV